MTYHNSVNNLFLNRKVTTVAADYTVLPDDVIISVSNTSNTRQITLPPPTAENVGRAFLIKDSSGGASTHPITVKSTSGWIDGKPTQAISYDYGCLEVYSDGTQYFTHTTTSDTFARGGWKKFDKNLFDIASTQIHGDVKEGELLKSSARLNLADLPVAIPPEGLKQAGGEITFMRGGLYQVIFQAVLETGGHPTVQLVKNDATIVCYSVSSAAVNVAEDRQELSILHTAQYEANDFIDLRIGKLYSKGSYRFYIVSCFVQQLPLEMIP